VRALSTDGESSLLSTELSELSVKESDLLVHEEIRVDEGHLEERSADVDLALLREVDAEVLEVHLLADLDLLTVDEDTETSLHGTGEDLNLITISGHDTDLIDISTRVSEASGEVIALSILEVDEARVDLELRVRDQVEVLIRDTVNLEILTLETSDLRITADDGLAVRTVIDTSDRGVVTKRILITRSADALNLTSETNTLRVNGGTTLNSTSISGDGSTRSTTSSTATSGRTAVSVDGAGDTSTIGVELIVTSRAGAVRSGVTSVTLTHSGTTAVNTGLITVLDTIGVGGVPRAVDVLIVERARGSRRRGIGGSLEVGDTAVVEPVRDKGGGGVLNDTGVTLETNGNVEVKSLVSPVAASLRSEDRRATAALSGTTGPGHGHRGISGVVVRSSRRDNGTLASGGAKEEREGRRARGSSRRDTSRLGDGETTVHTRGEELINRVGDLDPSRRGTLVQVESPDRLNGLVDLSTSGTNELTTAIDHVGVSVTGVDGGVSNTAQLVITRIGTTVTVTRDSLLADATLTRRADDGASVGGTVVTALEVELVDTEARRGRAQRGREGTRGGSLELSTVVQSPDISTILAVSVSTSRGREVLEVVDGDGLSGDERNERGDRNESRNKTHGDEVSDEDENCATDEC